MPAADDILEPVLLQLARDARLTAAQIADAIGAAAEDVEAAIAAAEARGIILSRGAKVNWEALGLSTVYAAVEVSVEPQEKFGYNAVARRIARFDEVQSVYFVSGTYDLLVMIAADNMRSISDFVGDRLAAMSGVKGTTTRVVMRRYKEDGVFIDQDLHNDRQQVVF